MESIIQKIKTNRLFTAMNEDDIFKILKCSSAYLKDFNSNELILEKDEKVTHIGIVVEGELNLVSQKYSGSKIIITSLIENDFFGEALVFAKNNKMPYSLVSVTKSEVLFIPKDFFVNTCELSCNFHNKLVANMLSILSDKLTMLNNKMKILNSETIRNKIAIYLISIYEKTNSMMFEIPMKRQELSEYLNTTRPSLSREFSNMQNEGILELYRSTVKIKNIELLYELSE